MFEELLDFDCACGHRHSLTTRICRVASGAAGDLPGVLSELGVSRPLLVYDQNTYDAASEAMNRALPDADFLILEGDPVRPDELQAAAIAAEVPGHDILLAVGSGVICDLTRYTAFREDLPFAAVPTAASVDGYVSGSSAMTLKGAKITLPTKAPEAVICDLDIIAAAPMRLTASGVGDMLSKYISIADWKVGHLTSGEYYCGKIADLEKEAVDLVVSQADGLARREKPAMEALMKGLLLSGFAMQLSGITRPASSFEHHFSHYLETVPVGGAVDTDALHGEKVGVATVYAAWYYPVFAESLRRIDAYGLENGFDLDKVKALYARFPRSVVEWVEKENTPTVTRLLDRELLKENFDGVLKAAQEIPSPVVLRETLEKVGGLTSYEDLHMTREEFRETMKICCYIRNRYTLLRLVCDYGLYDFDTADDPAF